MVDIKKITNGSTTFVIVGSGKTSMIFLKTNLQTIKLTWIDPKEPQRSLMRKIAKDIGSGKITTVPELFVACGDKIVGVNASNWYVEYTK